MWIPLMKAACGAHYSPTGPSDVLGYYRGTGGAATWRAMDAADQAQMVILGNKPPTPQDWVDAGGGQCAGQDVILRAADLQGFIIGYAGFPRRPWGYIWVFSPDIQNRYAGIADNWRRNYQAPR